MKIECVIFDLDGTLVDSEGLCNQAFLDLIPELEHSLDELVGRYRGKKLAPILKDIEKSIGRALPAEFENIYRARVAELFDTELKPMPGVCQMLRALDYPICVASSGPREKIGKALAVSSLDSFFGKNIFSSYEIGSWKPEPGLFLHAAKTMGYPAESCAVIEDSPPGIQAARAARMSPFQYSQDRSVGSHVQNITFNDMTELPSLLKGFQRKMAEPIASDKANKPRV